MEENKKNGDVECPKHEPCKARHQERNDNDQIGIPGITDIIFGQMSLCSIVLEVTPSEALITNKIHESVDSFKALNTKIIADQIQTKSLNVSFVQLYAPTEVSEE